jgi:hypothetical protein
MSMRKLEEGRKGAQEAVASKLRFAETTLILGAVP